MLPRLIALRRLAVFLLHVVLVVLANYAALWLRFDDGIPADTLRLWSWLLPTLVAIRLLFFFPFKLYEGLWRYTSLSDVRDICLAVLGSSLVFFLIVYFGLQAVAYPRSVYLIDALLLIALMTTVRLTRRLYREFHPLHRGKRVVVYGAGNAGEMIVRDMRQHSSRHRPVAFVDDDRRKVGHRIHGVPVLGTRDDLPAIMERKRPDEVLIALPAADGRTIRAIVRSLEPFKIPIMTLPSLHDLADRNVGVANIRDLAIEDLLPRAPIGLDSTPLRALVAGKTVMVTGAGGSIGSEICRQVAALDAKALLLFERSENSLFAISNELLDQHPDAHVESIVGDVCDWNRVCQVFSRHRPDVVFHAAAHKHVPLMEANPCEAVKNNVGGTWVVAQVARQGGVGRFVMISTDKAVNPTSVMGATKRVCELIVQSMAKSQNGSGTRFAVVRFGNVLGSNGSVVPRFLQQIRAGGPVTVTHPDMTRYFILIPEAVQLVLHAATQAQGGEVFLLDMGEQLKVLDIARNLIRLAGYVPEREIKIEFTGLRPGEKLSEELVGHSEEAERLPIDKILRVRRNGVPEWSEIEGQVQALYRAAVEGNVALVVDLLSMLVPTFTPGPIWPQTIAAVPRPPEGLAEPPFSHGVASIG